MAQRRWRMGSRFLLLVGLAALAVGTLSAAEKSNEARIKSSEDRMRLDVTFLASPECEGRGPTTKGINLAADYIAAEFKKAGLKPAGKNGSYFQPFNIEGSVLEDCGPLVLHGPNGQSIELQPGVHFHPHGMGSTAKLTDAPLVFAGYGITSAKDPEYDDYQDLNAAGKVVVVLRDTPRALSKQSISGTFRRRYSSFTEKIVNAQRHKAAGIIFVNDWETAQTGDDLVDFNYTAIASISVRLPAFHMSRRVLEDMLASRGLRLRDLEEDIDRELKPHSAALYGWEADLDLKVHRSSTAIALKNVVGVLEGHGKLANETVVIGAHYDHVGYGGQSSLSGSKKMAIHHGADDNASGTTTILELARRFAQMPNRDGRRLVFMAYSGEEINLLGSDHYCKEPIFPLADTVAMINLDMVGRLRPDKDTKKDRLTVYGTGTAKTFDDLIETLNKKHDFTLKKIPTGMGPSDQMSFYLKKIPVFFFFTDDHPDYHRPSDTADKINVAGMRRIADLTEDLVVNLATVAERPEYVKVAGDSPFGVKDVPRMGFKPGSYGEADGGVMVAGVTPGGPADKGGLKEGDRIVEIAGKPVKNMTGYMTVMGTQKRGQPLEITIVRDNKKMMLKVTPE